MPVKLYLLIGIVFSVAASLMAFLIIYDEYRKHGFTGWRLWKEALAGALFTFAVFLVLTLAAGYWLSHFVS